MTENRAVRIATYVACLATLTFMPLVISGKAAGVSALESSVAEAVPADSQTAGTDTYAALENEYLSVIPSIPDYTIEPDLSNVVNLSVFEHELSDEQRARLALNGFVVSPSDYEQIFYIYEENDYHDPRLGSFITADSMLHTYHFFFDYVLREIETEKFIPVLSQLTEAMLKASQEDLAAAENPDIEDAALRNLAFFAVARSLLNGTTPPEIVADMASGELEKIEAHEGRNTSAIFDPILIDYSQFVPRGHYTRSLELKKYFRTMMWYGLAGFPIPGDDIGLQPTRMALMIVRNLDIASDEGTPAMALWETIYEPTTFFVGVSDDLTLYDYSRLMSEVYGPAPQLEDFADDVKIQSFISKVENLPGPGIEQYVPLTGSQEESGNLTAGWRQFKFMGQRFIPDSRILQELVLPKVSDRLLPTGLDILAAMGSDRALEILRTSYGVGTFPDYDFQMNKVRTEISETSRETWESDLYHGWLWSLQSIITPAPEGYPAFMRNDAWQDKSLFTALGSWTELRHDTVLYARQSGAECGDGGEKAVPKSYVEPNIEFWTKLLWLVRSTDEGLTARGLSDESLTYRFESLEDDVSFCREMVIKELANQEPTDDEYGRMQRYGGSLEGLLLSCAGGDLLSEADKDMAVVVDVHTALDTVLQEGTGRAACIYVIVPINGDLYLTRGAIFTQYEFTHPASDRLTDEKWRDMLDAGQQPPLAEWTDSFIVGAETDVTDEDLDSGC